MNISQYIQLLTPSKAIKAQRLRVFRTCGYLPASCVSDDDEFEPKTVYFGAFLAEAIVDSSTGGKAKAGGRGEETRASSMSQEELEERLVGASYLLKHSTKTTREK